MKKACYLTLAALTLAAASTGCVGRFALTGNLNSTIRKATDNKWVNEIIFLVCAIFPVYSICVLVDAVIFNSIEFWGGSNPGDGILACEGIDAQGNAYAVVPNADGSAILTYQGEAYTLVRDGNTIAVSKDGTYLGTIAKQGSMLSFNGVDGTARTYLR